MSGKMLVCAMLLLGGIAAAALLVSGATANSDAADAKLQTAKLGAAAPNFKLVDQDGHNVSLSDFQGKIVVLEWMNVDCPYVQRHYREKTFTTLAAKYKSKNVAWIAINSTNDVTNAIDRKWAADHQVSYPILNDASGKVGHAYGARTTPDLFIVDAKGTLRYSGGIDNDPDGDKGAARVNYVDKALAELTAGKPVSIPKTPSYGCHVAYAD